VKITTDGGGNRTRHHRGWGHGLAPGAEADINCGACQAEDGPVAAEARTLLESILQEVGALQERAGQAGRSGAVMEALRRIDRELGAITEGLEVTA
jgi:hypothetical protein